MNTDKCKLCEKENVEIQKSHIIPEFLYTPIYDSKHRFLDFKEDPSRGVKLSQKGIRERLFCKKCETLLSKYEKALQIFFENINNSDSVDRRTILPGYYYIENQDYKSIKIALLSILYRLSISKYIDYNGYELGSKSCEIQDIILNDKFIDQYKYSIHLGRVVHNTNYSPSIILTYEKSSRYKYYNLNSFVIYGYLVDILTSTIKTDDIWNRFNLKENGSIIVDSIEIKDIGIKHSIIKRFKDDDVIKLRRKLI